MVETLAGDVEFPTVIGAADAAHLVAAEEERRAAVRAAVIEDADPAFTASRKATSFSPSIIRRTGSPSAFSSDERQSGIQN